MCQKLSKNTLVGQRVKWRTGKSDAWKFATITSVENGFVTTFGEYREENVFSFQQSNVLLESADLEYIYCAAENGCRFRGYAILEAVIYPSMNDEKWSESKLDISDFPVAVVNGCAYAIDQFMEAGDTGEFNRNHPDLALALSIMFQLK